MRWSSVLLALGVTVAWRAPMEGQSFMLQIRPRVGDTLRMRLDQQSEMTGTKSVGGSESTAISVTTMQMFSRAIVEGMSPDGTTVLAVTDSVLLSTSDGRSRGSGKAAASAPQSLRGTRVRFHVAPDGAVTMSGDDKAPREVAEAVAVMPAAFPKAAVSVGESWIREMVLPGGSQLGTPLSGKLRVTFRLDSVTRGGDLAYVSMRGEMQPATGLGAAAAGSTLEKGSVSGTMLVDRRRGWLTESRFNIAISSTITAPATAGIAAMHMRVKITQHMRTVDKR